MSLPPLALAPREALRDSAWDLVVVGLGVVGLSAILAAARNGWRVLGLEAGDVGGGASSASTRLWHGGIRYLDDGAEAMVREGLECRERWAAAFPWAATWRQFHALAATPTEAAQWRARVGKYAELSPRELPASDWMPAETAVQSIGGLRGWSGTGAWTYTELTFEESRVLPALARQAIAAGAVIAVDSPVLHAQLRDGTWHLPVTSPQGGADVVTTDRLLVATGQTTPQWATDLGVPAVVPHWGTHILVDRTQWPLARAIAWHHPEDGRLLYAFPMDGQSVLVGTTATEDQNPERDRDYLLRAVSVLARREGVSAGSVMRVWSGARPLLANSADPAARDMRVVAAMPGLVAAQGGKWTTAPLLAERALAALEPELAWGGLAWAASHTAAMPERPEHISVATWTRWLRKFGPEAGVVATLAADRLGALRALGTHDILAAEVLYVQEYEGAITPERIAARLDAWHDSALMEALGAAPSPHGMLLPA